MGIELGVVEFEYFELSSKIESLILFSISPLKGGGVLNLKCLSVYFVYV